MVFEEEQRAIAAESILASPSLLKRWARLKGWSTTHTEQQLVEVRGGCVRGGGGGGVFTGGGGWRVTRTGGGSATCPVPDLLPRRS